jgi:pimeloyl-ACP methyl ester carboxylesterase
VDIVFDRRGDGPPLVLLHGIGHRRQAWDPVMDALAKERDVIAVDLPGFGDSPPLPPGIPYTVDATLDRLTGLFDRLALGRPHIAGNSLGGLFSLVAADRGLVSSATTFSPAGFYNARELAVATAMLRASRRGARLPERTLARLAGSARRRKAMFGMIYGRPELIDPGFEPALRAGRQVRFRGACADVPVTIAWGTSDRLLRMGQAVRAQRTLPDARFIWLEGCGHVPMWDAPELVARVLLDGSAHPLRNVQVEA